MGKITLSFDIVEEAISDEGVILTVTSNFQQDDDVKITTHKFAESLNEQMRSFIQVANRSNQAAKGDEPA